jgi:hypothetical protein
MEDDPKNSVETLRIMVELEKMSDKLEEQGLGWAATVMDQARHRLAVLQQFCNVQGPQ